MQIEKRSNSHLTYCTNIHPGEHWQDHFEQLKIHLPELKKRLSPDKPFGMGLRLAAEAAKDLLKDQTIQEFNDWMNEEGLYLFAINGFPYGSFHHSVVKDKVYAPDWQQKERLDYTLNLVSILAELLPENIDGGISTSPISYKYWDRNQDEEKELIETACRHLAEAAFRMHRIQADTGKEIHLDIEPEPDCLIENSEETVHFFKNDLWTAGRDYLIKEKGIEKQESLNMLKNHIRVCYDTCHLAVEFEEPEIAIQKLTNAGIRIGRAQLSAALKVELGEDGDARNSIRRKLEKFVESTYLHQVVEKQKDGSIKQYRDLHEALPHIENEKAAEWRIHFHVPIFTGQMGELDSTQDHLKNAFNPLFEHTDCKHFEIETYTWEVLPEHLKVDITDSIEREFRWVLEQL
jgi:hypothetical protein